MRESTPGRAAFAFIFATVALDMLALGIIVPVLPKLIVSFEGGDMAAAARVSGVFGMAWALMQFLFSPVLGSLSDRFGRRPVVLLSNLGLGLDYVLMALAPSLPWLFAGRVISGITSASFSTAAAYIADVTPAEGRAARFGMLGAAFGLGFIVGPAVGGLLGSVDLRFPFWGAAALSLANAAYGYFILPESLPADRRAPFRWALANPFGSVAMFRPMVAMAVVIVLTAVAHEVLPSVFVLYTDHRYRWTEAETGTALAVVGISSTVVSAALVGPAVKRLGEGAAAMVGLACGALGFVVYGLAETGGIFLAGIPLVGLWGIANPALQGLMSREIGPSEQGRLQGALSSVRGICGVVSPLLFTQLLATAISAETLPGAPFLLAGALLVAALLVVSRQRTR